jgi:hypothetical protein
MDKILINSGPSARGFHRLELFMRCPMLYAWNKLKPEANKSLPLVRGSICHVGLAHLYNRAIPGVDRNAYCSPIEAMGKVGIEMDASGDLVHGSIACIKAYSEYWAQEDFEVVAVEHPLSIEFGPYLYTARIDLTVRDARGIWFYDHKISGRLTKNVADRYTLSGQMLGLWHIGHETYGNQFAGVKLNLIQFDPPRFERQPVDPAPFRLSRFPLDVIAIEDRIAALEQSGLPLDQWPAHPSEMTCLHSYGPCPFREQCRWGKEVA